jgi:hypothetical protein
LRFDARKRMADGFGPDDANRPAVGVEHVVGLARAQRELADCDAQGRENVHVAAVLHSPAALLKLPVN